MQAIKGRETKIEIKLAKGLGYADIGIERMTRQFLANQT